MGENFGMTVRNVSRVLEDRSPADSSRMQWPYSAFPAGARNARIAPISVFGDAGPEAPKARIASARSAARCSVSTAGSMPPPQFSSASTSFKSRYLFSRVAPCCKYPGVEVVSGPLFAATDRFIQNQATSEWPSTTRNGMSALTNLSSARKSFEALKPLDHIHLSTFVPAPDSLIPSLADSARQARISLKRVVRQNVAISIVAVPSATFSSNMPIGSSTIRRTSSRLHLRIPSPGRPGDEPRLRLVKSGLVRIDPKWRCAATDDMSIPPRAPFLPGPSVN